MSMSKSFHNFFYKDCISMSVCRKSFLIEKFYIENHIPQYHHPSSTGSNRGQEIDAAKNHFIIGRLKAGAGWRILGLSHNGCNLVISFVSRIPCRNSRKSPLLCKAKAFLYLYQKYILYLRKNTSERIPLSTNKLSIHTLGGPPVRVMGYKRYVKNRIESQWKGRIIV